MRPRGVRDDELLAQQVRLDLVAQRVRRQVHGGGQRLDAGRAALEDADQRFQIAAVLLVQPVAIDLGHVQGGAGHVEGDRAVGLAGGVVARPPQARVGDARRAAAAAGQFQGGVVGDGRVAACGALMRTISASSSTRVELQVLVHLEAVAHRAGQHAAARRGADQRELLQLHRDRAGVDALAQHDVDPEILHRRVDELLDHARHAVDLVDEQDRPFLDVGEEGQQVGRLGQGRAAGHLQRRAQFVGQDRGERGLAQAGRAVEEDVRHRLLELAAGVEHDAQSLHHRLLADDFAEPARPQGGIALLAILGAASGLDDRFSGHENLLLALNAPRAFPTCL